MYNIIFKNLKKQGFIYKNYAWWGATELSLDLDLKWFHTNSIFKRCFKFTWPWRAGCT